MKSFSTILFSTLAYVVVMSASFLSGCSDQQMYRIGQAWQQNQCNQTMVNESDRERCLSNANTSYEDYKQQTEGKK